jgi:hypothetical protein
MPGEAMRIMLCVGLFLSLSVNRVSCAQVLNLDQLISLRAKSSIEIDAYLVAKGWRFAQAEVPNDSTQASFWIYNDAHQHRLAEFVYRKSGNQFPEALYSTSNRTTFDAIRNKVRAYKMEFQGEQNEKGAIWSFFRGVTYDVNLAVATPAKAAYTTWYTIAVQPHGMIRAYRDDGDGKMTPVWINSSYLNNISAEQARRLQAKIDSIATLK